MVRKGETTWTVVEILFDGALDLDVFEVVLIVPFGGSVAFGRHDLGISRENLP